MIKDYFRNGFGKLLLLMITISFILSSIGGVLFFSNKYNIIVVNGNKINYKKFIKLLTKEREFAYSNGEADIDYLTSREFTAKSVEKFVNSELLKSFADDNNFQLKKEFIVSEIVKNKNFTKNGEFNPNKYIEFLKSANISEEDYVKLMSDFYSNMFLLNLFVIDENFDNNVLDMIAERNNTHKIANLYEVSKNSIKIKEVDVNDDELKKYYNENIKRFTHSEERKVDYIKIDLTKTDRKISDEEIDKYYNSNIDKYKIPETYDIYYLETTKKDDLNKIIKSKNTRELLANIKKIFNKDEDEITIKELPIDILNYVFGKENVENIKINTFSKIVEKNGIYMVFYIKNKNKERTMDLSEVRNIIIEELQRDTSDEFVKSNYKKIQDIINNKKDILKISKSLNLNIDSIGYIKLDSNIGELKNDKHKIFSAKIDDINQSFKGNYLYLYVVSDIKKSYLDKFDDIKSELINEVKKDKEDRLYLEQVLIENKHKYKVKKEIVIKKNDNKYSKLFINELYKLKNGKTTKVYIDNEKLYFADAVSDKSIDKNDSNFISQDAVKNTFNTQINDSVNYYYLKYLREKYKIYINQNLLNYL